MKFKIGDIVAVTSKATMPWLKGHLGIIHKIYKGENGTVKYGVMIEGKNNTYSKDGAYWFWEHEIEHVRHEKATYSAYPKINGYMDTNEAITKYILNDIDETYKLYLNRKEQEAKYIMSKLNVATIKNVIFNHPATIVFWVDGTKTVVKAENEGYDPEKGLAMAIAKKALGDKGNYYNVFRKWLPKKKKESSCAVSIKENLDNLAKKFNPSCTTCRFSGYSFYDRSCITCDPSKHQNYEPMTNKTEVDDDNIL